jgi:hypothetical protein
MAKAARRSKPSKRKSKQAKRPAEPPPVRRLRSKAPVELVEKLRQFEREAEAYWGGMQKVSAADRAELDRVLAIRNGSASPRRRRGDGPQVRFAKELMAVKYPGGEWRTMKIVAVHKGCEKEAVARGKPLPSTDSFAWAMGRRHRRR